MRKQEMKYFDGLVGLMREKNTCYKFDVLSVAYSGVNYKSFYDAISKIHSPVCPHFSNHNPI